MLSNVVYEWIVSGAPTIPSSSGVSIPDTNFAVFRIDCVPPTDAEELIVWDSTNITNWNVAGYRAGLDAIAAADQILLTAPYVPTTGPSTIIPGSPAEDSICRCYGTWKDISSLSVDGVPMTLSLVAVDDTDATLIYDLTATPLNQDPFVDMNRTDYISGAPTGTSLYYLLTCDVIGAPMSLSLLSSTSPITFQPVLFALDTTTIGAATGGTFDLSEKAVT